MKKSFFLVIVPRLHVRGMALFPFILLRERNLMNNPVIMNHERIHHRQQTEMLILPFYAAYLLNYLWNRLWYKNHREAYLNIVFEREAFSNQHDLSYLSSRKWFSFLHYR